MNPGIAVIDWLIAKMSMLCAGGQCRKWSQTDEDAVYGGGVERRRRVSLSVRFICCWPRHHSVYSKLYMHTVILRYHLPDHQRCPIKQRQFDCSLTAGMSSSTGALWWSMTAWLGDHPVSERPTRLGRTCSRHANVDISDVVDILQLTKQGTLCRRI